MANLNDVYKLRIVCYWPTGQQLGLMVRYFVATTKAGTGTTDANAAAAWDALLSPQVKPLVNPAANYRGVGFQRVWPLPAGLEAVSVLNSGAGSGAAGDMLPTQCCGLLTWTTAFSGRHYRGRSYIPFPGEADQSAGTFGAGYVGLCVSLGNTLVTPLLIGGGGNTNTFTPAVWNRVSHTPTTINGFFTHTNVATQRRRGTFGRINVLPF